MSGVMVTVRPPSAAKSKKGGPSGPPGAGIYLLRPWSVNTGGVNPPGRRDSGAARRSVGLRPVAVVGRLTAIVILVVRARIAAIVIARLVAVPRRRTVLVVLGRGAVLVVGGRRVGRVVVAAGRAAIIGRGLGVAIVAARRRAVCGRIVARIAAIG